jgi:tetratricopeptide (TPR) repeat protein
MSQAAFTVYPDLKVLKTLLKVLPNHTGVLAQIGGYHLLNYNLSLALRFFKKVEKIEKDNVLNWYDLARTYYRLDQFKQAAKYYIKAENHHSYFDDDYEEMAWSCQKAGFYKIAIRIYGILLISNPSNTNFLINMGYCLGKVEENEKAIEYTLKAQKINPRDKTALLNIGFRYWVLKDIPNARKYTELSLKIDPMYGYALMNMGHIYWAEGDKSTALDYYKQSVQAFADVKLFNTLFLEDSKYIVYYQVPSDEYEEVRIEMWKLGEELGHLK